MEKISIHRRVSLLKKIHIALASAAAVMLLGLGVTAGAETGAFTVIGGVEGTDYEYASGVLTIKTAEELTISTSGSTTDRIEVASSSGANITLNGVDIDNSANKNVGAFLISGSGNVTITLAKGSENTLKAGESCAGIQKNGSGLLTIDGSGELTAVGGMYASGIGGGDGKSASDITISGGIISATGGEFAAGIGGGWGDANGNGGDGSNITISGGAVTASSAGGGAGIGGGYHGTANNIVITGGSVLANASVYERWTNNDTVLIVNHCPGIGGGLTDDPENSELYKDGDSVTPTDGNGNNVYLLTIPNLTGGEVIVNGTVFTPSQHPGTTELYFYLTAEEHTISVDGVETDYFFNPDSGKWTEPGKEFIITGTGLKHGTDFIYPADTGILTILTDKAIKIANADPDTATDNIIVVADGVSANITLNGVNISSDNAAALEIIEDTAAGSVTITLAQGSENSLVSTGAFAALQKEGENGTLTISGSGTLTAQGGTAGIGGTAAHNITITNTTVTATGGANGGAGIGGVDGAVSDIVIEDSKVTATGGTGAAGIGSGNGTVTDITISGSIVTATGDGSAAGIGGSSAATVSGVFIDGGSVKVVKGSSSAHVIGGSGDEDVVPANKQDKYVYLLVIDNSGGEDVYIDKYDNPDDEEDVKYVPSQHSADDTNIYAYLLPTNHVVTVGDTDTPYYFDRSTNSFKCPELKVTGGKLNEDYSFDAGVVTILSDKALTIENYDKTTPASDTIVVRDGVSANITLNGVSIESSGSALTLGVNSAANITLADGADNVLKSAADSVVLSEGADFLVDGTGWLTIGSTLAGTDSSITIMSGSVTADSLSAAKVVIDGGSVKAASISSDPLNSGGDRVYLLTITDSDEALEIDGEAYAPGQHGIGGDANVYAYLTGEVHTVKLDKQYTYHFDGATFYLPDLNVYGEDVVYGVAYTYSNGVVTIRTDKPVTIENIDPDTATSDTIIIAGGVDADVTLNGVNISSSTTAPLFVEDGEAEVKLTLAKGSENNLTGGAGYAAVQMNGTKNTLEITGGGKLSAQSSISVQGALTISSGTITATAIDSADIVTISGGSVEADSINAVTVTINGGSVTADSITGSTKTEINGGSVKAGAISPAPVNSEGAVYLLTLENLNNYTIKINGREFLPKQHSSTDKNVYVYLTAEAHTVQIGSGDIQTYIYDQYNNKFVVIGSDLVVADGTYGLDYTYPVNDGILTILTDKALTVTSAVETTSDRIVIKSGVNANITLNGVNIETSAAALTAVGGDVTITPAEGSDNSLKSTGGNGIDVSGTGTLTITGTGTLWTSGAVGINAASASVTLDNCIVTADGGISAAATVIKGGSVKADTITAAPTDGNGNNVYLLTIEAGGKTVYVEGNKYPVQSHGIDGDTNVYAYLTGKTQVVKLDDEETVYVFDGTKFKLPDLVVSGSGVTFGIDYTYENGEVTIKTEEPVTIANNPDVSVTSDRIVTESGKTVDITLSGVNIVAETGAPIEINGSAKLTTASGTTNILASDDSAGILVNGSGAVQLSGDGELTSTISAAAGTVKITGGSVTAQKIEAGALEITGGSVKADDMLPAPTDGRNNVYLLIIPTNGEIVTVNDGAYPVPQQHSSGDEKIYAYLSGAEDQTVTVGEETTTYRYVDTKFLIVPTVDMFSVTLPTAPTYNGASITAQIAPDDAAITYTVKYYKDGAEVSDTSAAGTYTFEITVDGDDKYAAEELTDSSWTFTVEGASLDAPASLVYNVGYGYKAEDAVLDTNTGAMAVDGTWVLEYDGHFTESGNDYTAVFTPDDSNYRSFAFEYVQIVVNAVDPVVAAIPEAPRVIPGKSQTFAFKAEHPEYPEFTEGLPELIISISDGVNVSTEPTYTVDKNAVIGSTIDITVNIAGVDGKYNASSAAAVITVAKKLNVDGDITVDTDNAVYGTDPEPQGTFGGKADGEAEWSYSFASGDVGANGSFGTLDELYNEFGALDVGVYTVMARYEDAAHIGVGYGTFEVEPKKLNVLFKGNVSKTYDGTAEVLGYDMSADDFELTGLIGNAERIIDTAYISMEYTDVNAGTDKKLIISIADGARVLTADGAQDDNYSVVSEAEYTGAVITRRAVVVVPDEVTKVYGEDDPEFTFSVENIVGAETLSGTLSRDAGENAGTYALALGTVTNDNNSNYDITMSPAALTIRKAAAPVINATAAKHSWGAAGERSIAIVGMPDDMGEITSVDQAVTDDNDIMSDTVSYSDGLVTYTLNTNTTEKVGCSAVISMTVVSQNYEDVTFEVTVTVTEKEDQTAPALKLEFTEQADGAWTVTIAAVEGAEYKFADGEWSDVNYITNVQPNTYVAAYIRMAETETHNASEAVTVTELAPKTVVKAPVFSRPSGNYGSVKIEITCSTVGATILYTTNGADPLNNGEVYTEPVAINGPVTLKAIAIKDGMTNSDVSVAEYNKSTSSGGNGGNSGNSGNGGNSGSGSGNAGALDEDMLPGGSAGSGMPSVDGKLKSWQIVAQMISELPIGGELEVELNNSTVVPDYVIDVIAERDACITFEYNSLNHWYVDGSDIPDDEEHTAAYLDITYPVQIPSYELRGKAKWKFRMGNTRIPCTLTMDVDLRNAGNFANLYRYEDGELIFVDSVRIDEQGLAEFALTEKGDYVVMASMYSDIMGDTNNDGRVNTLDAVAILRDIVGLQSMPDSMVADCDANGIINVLDASAILKWIVGKTA